MREWHQQVTLFKSTINTKQEVPLPCSVSFGISTRWGLGQVQVSSKNKGMEIRGTELSPHVNLIESRQHCTCILGLLQTLSNAQPHPVHFLLKGKVGPSTDNRGLSGSRTPHLACGSRRPGLLISKCNGSASLPLSCGLAPLSNEETDKNYSFRLKVWPKMEAQEMVWFKKQNQFIERKSVV